MNTTASGFSTGSTIERPRPPDPQSGPPHRSVAAIVASLHGRAGKTLLARILADYFILSGRRPALFDTDAAERMLHAAFPDDAIVVDLTEVRDQMILFDTLVARSAASRVVDVSHHAARRFFKVMQESRFAAEARARRVEPVIFHIVDRNADSYEAARLLRERFDDCALVLVENAFLGKVKDRTRRSTGYQAFEDHELRMTLPLLDPEVLDIVEDMHLSLSDLMREPLSRGAGGGPLSFDERADLRGWLGRIFRDIHRLTRAVEIRALSLAPADPVI